MRLGDRIKELRLNAGMRQEALAEGICTRSYISLIENNQMIPSNDILQKLSAKLGFDLNSIKDSYHPSTPYKAKLDQIDNLLYNQNFKEAYQLLNEIPQDTDFPPEERAKWLWARGTLVAYENGLWSEGLEWCNEAITLLEHTAEHELLSKVYHLQGTFYYQLQKLEEAYTSYLLGIQEMSKADSPSIRYMVSHHVNIAHIHNLQKEAVTALYYLQRAQEMNNNARAFYHAGELSFQSGVALMNLGMLEEASKKFQLAESFYEFSGEKHYLGAIFSNLGIIHRRLGETATSLRYLQKAVEFYEKTAQESLLYNCSYEKMVTLTKLAKWQEARELGEWLARSLSTLTNTESKLTIQVELLLGEIFWELEQPAEAEKHLLLAYVLLSKLSQVEEQTRQAVLKRLIQYYENTQDEPKKQQYVIELLDTIH